MKKYLICFLFCFFGSCARETVEPNAPYYRFFDLLQYGNRSSSGKEFPILSGILPRKNGNIVAWKLTAFGNVAFEVDKQGRNVTQYNLNTEFPNAFASDYVGIAYLEERNGGLWGMDWSGKIFTDKNANLGYIEGAGKGIHTFANVHSVTKLSKGDYLVMLKKKDAANIDMMIIDPNGKTIIKKDSVILDNISFLHSVGDRTLAYPNMTTWEDKGFLKCLMSVRARSFVYKYHLIEINLNNLDVKRTPLEPKNIADNADKEMNNYIGEGWGFGYKDRFFTCFIERSVFAINFTESTVYYIENDKGEMIQALDTPVPLNSSGTDLFIIPHKDDLYLVHITRNYNIQIIKYSGLDSKGLPIERKRKRISFGFVAYLINVKISEEGDLFILTEPTSDEKKVGVALIKVPKEEL